MLHMLSDFILFCFLCSLFVCLFLFALFFVYFFLFAENFEQMNKLDCPVDCEKYSYEYQLSSALFLPDRLLPMVRYSYLKSPKNLPNDTEAMAQFML